MQHDRHPLGPIAEDRERVLLGLARVDDDREPDPPGDIDLRLERAPLVGARRVVAEVVEAGLADRADRRIGGHALEALDVSVGEPGGLVRMPSHDREDLLVRPRRLEGALRGGGVDPDRGKPRDADRPGALHERRVGRLAVVEMAMAVDHS